MTPGVLLGGSSWRLPWALLEFPGAPPGDLLGLLLEHAGGALGASKALLAAHPETLPNAHIFEKNEVLGC